METSTKFIARRLELALIVLALFLTAAMPMCIAIDRSICGLWKTTIHRPDGNDILVEWKINPSGSYTVTSFENNGAGRRQTENGQISTQGNRYSKTTNIGPDNGTFQVMNNRQFSTTGRFGFIEWTRIDPAQSAANAGSSSNPFPSVYGRYNQQANQSNGYNPPVTNPNGAYNPEMNPRSATWNKMGFGEAGPTRDPSYYHQGRQQTGGGDMANLRTADLHALLFSNFPLRGGGDEVEQFALPALGKAAAGGMRKRDFRMIQ